jgi:hypothetical protein
MGRREEFRSSGVPNAGDQGSEGIFHSELLQLLELLNSFSFAAIHFSFVR